MLIFLLGYMGSGKTTIGKKLARRLGYRFVDLDNYIEEFSGKTISEIFATDGEEKFREIEKQCLCDIFKQEKTVVSTGGGTPCFYDNMSEINKAGISVYISMNPEALASRLEQALETRPLIDGLKGDDLKEYIRVQLKMREAFYLKANHVVNGLNVDVKKIIALLEKEIQ